MTQRTWTGRLEKQKASAKQGRQVPGAVRGRRKWGRRRDTAGEPVGADASRIETGRNGKHGAASGGAEDRQPFITA